MAKNCICSLVDQLECEVCSLFKKKQCTNDKYDVSMKHHKNALPEKCGYQCNTCGCKADSCKNKCNTCDCVDESYTQNSCEKDKCM